MNLIDPKILQYCIDKSDTPSSLCGELESYTRENVHGAQMLIGQLEASVLGFLLRSIGAKRVLELGTFTGYSALCMAQELPVDGEVITLDINETTVEIAKSYWAKSPDGKKITSIIGPGLESLKKLDGTFDFVFIDADKRNYLPYLEKSLELLSDKGMIVIDNVLWSGRVVEAPTDSEDEHRNTKFIRELNDVIKKRSDLYGSLLPIRDGMFLITKKKY